MKLVIIRKAIKAKKTNKKLDKLLEYSKTQHQVKE